jgi:hypothetical protein
MLPMPTSVRAYSDLPYNSWLPLSLSLLDPRLVHKILKWLACNGLYRPASVPCAAGGCKEQIERMREVVELPMLHPERFVALGIDPPKGVLCYGPPGARPRDLRHASPPHCLIRSSSAC